MISARKKWCCKFLPWRVFFDPKNWIIIFKCELKYQENRCESLWESLKIPSNFSNCKWMSCRWGHVEIIYQLCAGSLQSWISYWTGPHNILPLSFGNRVQISSSRVLKLWIFLLVFTVNKTDCLNLTAYLENWIKSKQNMFLSAFMVHPRADRKPTMPQGSFSPHDKQTHEIDPRIG